MQLKGKNLTTSREAHTLHAKAHTSARHTTSRESTHTETHNFTRKHTHGNPHTHTHTHICRHTRGGAAHGVDALVHPPLSCFFSAIAPCAEAMLGQCASHMCVVRVRFWLARGGSPRPPEPCRESQDSLCTGSAGGRGRNKDATPCLRKHAIRHQVILHNCDKSLCPLALGRYPPVVENRQIEPRWSPGST